MMQRRRRADLGLVLLSALLVASQTGCGSFLNPSLLDVLGLNTTPAVEASEGNIIILLMNRGAQNALATLQVTKDSGASLEYTISLQAFGDPQDRDFRAITQECDVFSIELTGIQTTTIGGGVQDIPVDAQRILKNVHMYCGDVVAILIPGFGLPPEVVVY